MFLYWQHQGNMSEERTLTTDLNVRPSNRTTTSEDYDPDRRQLPSLRKNTSSLVCSMMTSYWQHFEPANRAHEESKGRVASAEPTASQVGPVAMTSYAQPTQLTENHWTPSLAAGPRDPQFNSHKQITYFHLSLLALKAGIKTVFQSYGC